MPGMRMEATYRTDTQSRASCLCLVNALDDTSCVSLELRLDSQFQFNK